MPRFKRKKHYRSNRKKKWQNNDQDDDFVRTLGRGLLPADRALLLQYLLDYKKGCERLCFANDISDDDTVVTAPSTTSSHADEGRAHAIVIGKSQRLPPLTNEVLMQPFLALPKAMSPKTRKAIHELCVDVDLFHCGVGKSKMDRHVVISIYSDGFQYVPDLQDDRTTFISARCCRPWYHRTDHFDNFKRNNGMSLITNGQSATTSSSSTTRATAGIHPHVSEQTRQGRAQIEALLDQPGKCLRNHIDKLDFKQIDGQDLSHIEPPGLGMSNGEVDFWMLVDSAEKMQQCVQELQGANPTEIGFDMEMWNASKYTQVTCLIQLSSNQGKEYVIDTLAPGVWDHVSLLAPLFANPAIVKIGHSIGSLDVPSLHRDFGIFVVNAFDTYEAAQKLKPEQGLGLAKVCESYGMQHVEKYKSLKNEYQRTDWRVRPLSDEMIQYGRYDVHYLIALRKLMIRDLTRSELWDNVGSNKEAERRMIARALTSTIKRLEREEDEGRSVLEASESMDISIDMSRASSDSNDDDGYFTPPSEQDPNSDVTRHSQYDAADLRMQPNLMRVISLSQQRCLALWSHKSENPTKNGTFTSVIYRAGKGELVWTVSHGTLYEDLVKWRSTVAKREGVLPGLVCDLDWLVLVALKRPTCEASLRRIEYFLPHLLENSNEYVAEVLSFVRASVEKDGLKPTLTIRKYSASYYLRGKRASLGQRIGVTLGTLAAIGAVTVVVVAVARKKR